MANRPTPELAKKTASKFDPEMANIAFQWITAVLQTGENADLASELGTVSTPKDVQTPLKDGVILCHLINTIKPGSVKEINTSKMAFKQMENIGNFQTGCKNLGVQDEYLFLTVDLYEATNIPQVVTCIRALGSQAEKVGYNGPRLSI